MRSSRTGSQRIELKATLGSQFIPGKKEPTNKSDSLPLQLSPLCVHQVTPSAAQTADLPGRGDAAKEGVGKCVTGCVNHHSPLPDRGLLKDRMEQRQSLVSEVRASVSEPTLNFLVWSSARHSFSGPQFHHQ